MSEPNARRRSVLPATLCAVTGIVLLAAGMLGRAVRDRAPEDARGPASSAEVATSLTHGVAWIWPGSNGPLVARGDAAPYREAAVLVESLVLRASGVEHGGRTQPLALPDGVRLVPVVHVEATEDAPAEFTRAQRDAVVAAVRRHAGAAAAGAGLLQLDFEAPARERDAYRALVATVREALPAGVRLSVTALAHWCTQGDWLDRLSVDEVVPMLYRLGPRADDWRRRFAQDDAGLARRCRGPALGFATNDPPPAALLARTARPYWFDEAAWSNSSQPPRHPVP
jgi:hypothetical protein